MISRLSPQFTTIPGLMQTVDVSSAGVLYISTDGGLSVGSSGGTAFTSVDIAIFVDGAQLPNGGVRRIQLSNVGPTGLVANWSFALGTLLSPGSHTVQVAAALSSGISSVSAAIVSGDAGSALQGQLTVLILKQ